MKINFLLIYLIILFANFDQILTISIKINKSNAQSQLKEKIGQKVK